MAELHETVYGKRFFDYQLPTLIKHLGDIAGSLKDNAISKGNKDDLKVGELGTNKDKIIFTGEIEDATKYAIGRLMLRDDDGISYWNYYFYVDGSFCKSPGFKGTFGSFQEVLEFIAEESGLV